MRVATLLLLPVLALAGCASESRVTPVTSSRVTGGAASQEPEPANSLPRGSAVVSPLTPAAGNVGNTRVAPAARTGY